MAFEEVKTVDCSSTISLGGFNKKTKKANPTRFEGYYIGSKTVPNKLARSGEAYLHVFQTAKGNVGVWGKSDLDRKITAVQPGLMVRVTMTGTVPTDKGNDMYVYKVEADKSNTIDVSGLVDANEGAADSTDDEAELNEYTTASDDGIYEEEASADADEEALDELPPARPAAPKKAASAPDAARQAKMKALLEGRTRKTA